MAACDAAKRGNDTIAPVGIVLALAGLFGCLALPFVELKPNRIASGELMPLWLALPQAWGIALSACLMLMAAASLARRGVALRLSSALLALAVLLLALGRSADLLTPPEAGFARLSQASGFWLLLLVCGLFIIDAMAQMRITPWMRIVLMALGLAALALLLASGAWDRLAIMREYAARESRFWQESRQHLLLVAGSLAPALLVGIPLGILANRRPALRGAVLTFLNMVQTIPSIALFGLLLTPLAMLAAACPLLASLGIRGIGAAPAILALFLYALLPIVANTIVGLAQVAEPVIEAARGMGLTRAQILWRVRLPLAAPVMLAAVRIVLVQNIGLAAVAALIGGGGFGAFIFEGMGQTAMDLVLLGAVPIVLMAFSAALILDSCAQMLRKESL